MNALSPRSPPADDTGPRSAPTMPKALIGLLYYQVFVAIGVLIAVWRCYGPGKDSWWSMRYLHELFDAMVMVVVLGPFNELRYQGHITYESVLLQPLVLGFVLMAGILGAPRLVKPWQAFIIEVVCLIGWLFGGLAGMAAASLD